MDRASDQGGLGSQVTDTTALLLRWNSGDGHARDRLLEHIYRELTQIAARHLARESTPHTLQPQALVHEAYLKLVDMNRVEWQNRAHFLAMSAQVMRRILIDEARKRLAAKRDGGVRVTLSGISSEPNQPNTDVLMLHEALEKLAEVDADRARLVELRFFGSLTIQETAEVVGTSPATVKRHWEVARGWLYRTMTSGSDPSQTVNP